MKTTLAVAAAWTLAYVAHAASPQATEVAISQSGDSNRTVRVEYALSEEAIVTVDFQTNTLPGAAGVWVSIGASNFTNVTGDVNRLVPATSGAARRSIVWPTREKKQCRGSVCAKAVEAERVLEN